MNATFPTRSMLGDDTPLSPGVLDIVLSRIHLLRKIVVNDIRQRPSLFSTQDRLGDGKDTGSR